jgi:SRSO17 transposase
LLKLQRIITYFFRPLPIPALESADAVLVIDDTAIPKKGTHSVGVAPQYASALGKTANCQTLVSLTLARGEVPVVLALRLFLPES